jgi:hypothetical protein
MLPLGQKRDFALIIPFINTFWDLHPGAGRIFANSEGGRIL